MNAQVKSWVTFFLTFSAVSLTTLAQTDSNSIVYFSDYVISGVKIRAGFVPGKTVFVQDEPLLVTFTVQNLSSTNFPMSFDGDYRRTGRHDRFKVAVTNSAGEPASDPAANNWGMGGGIGQEFSLKPGENFTNVFDLAQFRIIDKPGFYTVDCTFLFDDHVWVTNRPVGPTAHSSFNLTILERSPEHVETVIQELLSKAQQAHGQNLKDIFLLIAKFAKEASIPYLATSVKNGSKEYRKAAIGSLPSLPTDASLDLALVAFQDPEPEIRAAAAASLGEFKKPRAVEALLKELPAQKSPVAEAIIVALGASQSEAAFPVITNALDGNDFLRQRAAVDALANYGGSNAVNILRGHINSNYLALRYRITKVLSERLRQPIQAEWLLPVLMQREQTDEWTDSMRLLQLYTGKNAAPTLLSCLDFDAAWSGRNWWILGTVEVCTDAPKFKYDHDPNSDGTPEQWEKNLRTLEYLKTFAGPIPTPPKLPPSPLIEYLKTDPPIDFAPTFQELKDGGVEIKSGFLDLVKSRSGDPENYRPAAPYESAYAAAGRFRALPKASEQSRAEWHLSPEQMNQIDAAVNKFAVKLCSSPVTDQKIGNCVSLLINDSPYFVDDYDSSHRLIDYLEAPAYLKQQTKNDLLNSVVASSQNYHAGTMEFLNSVTNILTRSQVEQILR